MMALGAAGTGAATIGTVESGTGAAGAGDARLMQAARSFETNAIAQLLQPMFETVDLSSGEFGGGEGEKTWAPMMVTQMAQLVEDRGGLGLAAPVYREMLAMQEHAAGRTRG